MSAIKFFIYRPILSEQINSFLADAQVKVDTSDPIGTV